MASTVFDNKGATPAFDPNKTLGMLSNLTSGLKTPTPTSKPSIIPKYVNPATLNPATQPKISQAPAAPKLPGILQTIKDMTPKVPQAPAKSNPTTYYDGAQNKVLPTPAINNPSTNYALGTNPGAITINSQQKASPSPSYSADSQNNQTSPSNDYQQQDILKNQMIAEGKMDSNYNALPAYQQTAGYTQTNSNLPTYDKQSSNYLAQNGPSAEKGYTPQNTNLGNIASNLANLSTQPNATQITAQQGLLNTAQQSQEYKEAQAEANRVAQERANLTRDYSQKERNIQGTAGFLTQATGLEGLLNRQYGLAQTALSSQEASATSRLNAATQQQATQQAGYSSAGGLANTQLGLQQTGLNNAGSLVSPVGQFGMLTNPITGQPLNTGMFQTAVQQAQQLVNNGAPADSQAVQALLSPFGFVGQTAFNQAMGVLGGSGFNPAAQSAGANQNLTQGTQTQGQAYSLNLGLQQLKTIEPLITNFLSASGINSTDSPLYNQPINSYIAQLGNPAAMTQYQYLLNDLQKFASQMLAAGGGGTPTGTQAATDLMNPGLLSMKQIQSALSTLDTLGTNQVAVLQQQAQASGVNGYAGNPANISTSTPVASPGTAPGSGITNPVLQAGAGTGLNVWNQITSTAGALTALIGNIFK